MSDTPRQPFPWPEAFCWSTALLLSVGLLWLQPHPSLSGENLGLLVGGWLVFAWLLSFVYRRIVRKKIARNPLSCLSPIK